MHLTKRKTWSEEEICRLKYLYEDNGLGPEEIATIMNRSHASVWIKSPI
jgi:hypothetical protein